MSENVKTIRVFPRRTSYTPTDELAFVGDPPFSLLIPDDAEEVHVSVTFSWDMDEGHRLAVAWRNETKLKTLIGGPAFGHTGDEFTPGKYLKKGITITSRGCPNKCWFCVVPRRDGNTRTVEIKRGHILQDDTILACPESHQSQVLSMLKSQSKAASFPGGLDVDLIKPWHIDAISQMKIDQLFFAYDSDDEERLERLRVVANAMGLPRRKMRCYVLVGYATDHVARAETRCRAVWDAGMLPFAMYYQGKEFKRPSGDWYHFLRRWVRPAATFSYMKAIAP